MKWPSWFRRKAPAKPSFTACPKCGREMAMIEKYTMSGDDLRTYRCEPCGEEHILNFGTALWKVLSDAREEEEAGKIDSSGPLA
jgi:ribosomal protein S14